ncbi:MAG: hypothetical protein ACXAEU_06495 [Candidatus Hodarchaeales archaeon]|jgi:hypothetical protein
MSLIETTYDDEGNIKRLVPLKLAFPLAIVVPLVIEVVFSLLGAATIPLLGQIELILVLLSFCLTGILPRSALKGLLAVPAGIINYIILMILPMFWNPYGLFYTLSEPLEAIGVFTPETIATAGILLIAMDLIILIILTFFGGLFSGAFARAGIAGKVIFGIFLIVLLLILPFTYIGIAKTLEGGGYLLSTALEANTVITEMGTDVDQILGNQTLLDEFNQKLRDSGTGMNKAANALSFVQQNIFFSLILNLAGYGDLLQVLDIVPAVASFMDTAPYLLTGLFDLDKGMGQTFDFISQQSSGSSTSVPKANYKIAADYSNEFAEGLSYLEYAVGNFTSGQEGLEQAIQKIKSALSTQSLQQALEGANLDQVIDLLDQIGDSIPSIISVGKAAVPFINATYETFLGMESIGENDFIGAQQWMDVAATHFNNASGVLSLIETTDLWEPIADAVDVFTDMTDLLTDVVKVGSNATTTFVSFEAAFAYMEQLNRTQAYGTDTTNDAIWDATENTIQAGNTALNGAITNLNAAQTKLAIYNTTDYGMMAPIGEMFNQFGNLINQFAGNITDFGYAGTAISATFSAMKSFSAGVNALGNADYTQTTKSNFQWARDNATIADDVLATSGVNLNPDTILTWRTILKNGPPVDIGVNVTQQDLYHMSEVCIYLVDQANNDEYGVVAALLEALDFAAIFG